VSCWGVSDSHKPCFNTCSKPPCKDPTPSHLWQSVFAVCHHRTEVCHPPLEQWPTEGLPLQVLPLMQPQPRPIHTLSYTQTVGSMVASPLPSTPPPTHPSPPCLPPLSHTCGNVCLLYATTALKFATQPSSKGLLSAWPSKSCRSCSHNLATSHSALATLTTWGGWPGPAYSSHIAVAVEMRALKF
jgi:hypothetical protein